VSALESSFIQCSQALSECEVGLHDKRNSCVTRLLYKSVKFVVRRDWSTRRCRQVGSDFLTTSKQVVSEPAIAYQFGGRFELMSAVLGKGLLLQVVSIPLVRVCLAFKSRKPQ